MMEMMKSPGTTLQVESRDFKYDGKMTMTISCHTNVIKSLPLLEQTIINLHPNMAGKMANMAGYQRIELEDPRRNIRQELNDYLNQEGWKLAGYTVTCNANEANEINGRLSNVRVHNQLWVKSI